MIKYKLICKNCNLSFDSWFASNKEFEKLKRKNFLNCHNCNSKKIDKTLMAPSTISKSSITKLDKDEKKMRNIRKTIQKYQKFIKNNFKYVGENFAYEARSIHYKNKKNDKGIYGSASKEQIKDLKDEGIETQIIPWVENKDN